MRNFAYRLDFRYPDVPYERHMLTVRLISHEKLEILIDREMQLFLNLKRCEAKQRRKNQPPALMLG